MSLDALFTPRGVAVIGSMSPGKLGAVLLKQLIDGGYPGSLYAVNPKGQGAWGIPGYTSVQGIGQAVDLAIVASPAATATEVLEDCGQAGVKAAVVITAGFSEIGNREGERKLVEVAQKYQMRIVGPNCAGMVNTHHHLFPTLEWRPPQGGVALVSQSGALAGIVLAWADAQKLGISKFVSYGNGADLSQEELLHYLATDEETKVVALYIESIHDGRKFLQALSECARAKPVIVIKAGRTSAGKRATASHTGSLAGSDAVYDAAIRSCGAIRVKTVDEMLDLCRAFSACPPLRGKRVAIVTNSGGPAVLAADYGEEVGLAMVEPSQTVKDSLRQFLSANCALKNPIDLTVEGTKEGYRRTLEAVLQEYDAVVAMNICPPYLDAMGLAEGVVEAAKASGKPVLANFLPPQVVEQSVVYLEGQGLLNYSSGERAVTVLSQMARYYAGRSKACLSTPVTPAQPQSDQPDLFHGRQHLLEPEAMAWLKANGVQTPDYRWVRTAQEAAVASRELGFPLVMKVVSPDILHKSDHGGVVVGIRTQAAAQAAFRQIRKAAAGCDFQGVILYPMVKGAQEVLVGLSQDAQFGPVVAFGLGGIYTEIWQDVALRIAPVSKQEAQAMIHEIRSVKLLEGARGQQAGDLEALAELIAAVSQLPFTHPKVGEVDINPVFVQPAGVVIGDARVIKDGVLEQS